MKLRRPTDFLILEALEAHGRNVATNLAHHTGKSRKNVNTRLPVLEDYGLVRKIGPADRSGLYEITDRGRTALEYRDRYEAVEDFGELLDRSNTSKHDDRGNPGPSGVALARSGNDGSDDERDEE
jgi:DNA-binding MarR family transcriptional regulator